MKRQPAPDQLHGPQPVLSRLIHGTLSQPVRLLQPIHTPSGVLRGGKVLVGLADDVFQFVTGQKPPAVSEPFELRLIAPLQLLELGKRAAQGG